MNMGIEKNSKMPSTQSRNHGPDDFADRFTWLGELAETVLIWLKDPFNYLSTWFIHGSVLWCVISL